MNKLILTGLATALLVAAPAVQAKETRCTLNYNMEGGGAFVKRSTGDGTIRCDNGQSMRVTIESRGGGLTFGRSRIEDGVGRFSPVLDIKNLIGGYATAEANAGGGDSASKGQVVTKGSISLALSGRGSGRTLGVSFGSFIIKEAGKD